MGSFLRGGGVCLSFFVNKPPFVLGPTRIHQTLVIIDACIFCSWFCEQTEMQMCVCVWPLSIFRAWVCTHLLKRNCTLKTTASNYIPCYPCQLTPFARYFLKDGKPAYQKNTFRKVSILRDRNYYCEYNWQRFSASSTAANLQVIRVIISHELLCFVMASPNCAFILHGSCVYVFAIFSKSIENCAEYNLIWISFTRNIYIDFSVYELSCFQQQDAEIG